MNIVHGDSVFQVERGTTPDYNRGNSLVKLMGLVERVHLVTGRENYFGKSLQYLFPFKSLELYGPQGDDFAILDPTKQDNKTDFQKQNVRNFLTTDCYLVRGLVSLEEWTGPFLHLSYRAGVDSALSKASNHQLSDKIKLWLKIGDVSTPELIAVPYNPANDRYEVELWGLPDHQLLQSLDEKGTEAYERGVLVLRPDLIKGDLDDFERNGLNERNMFEVAPDNAMHPILPFHVELAWANPEASVWDSQNGQNYHYEFNMKFRGWNNFLSVGISGNPHGGVGFLEYRNLLSNYGRFAGSGELGRKLEAWNFNSFGTKNHNGGTENFLAVDYMDLHILKGNTGIGLHRHRDNQEVFLMMDGDGCFMVVGDWCKMPERERCFEVRTLMPGDFAMLKGGQLHGLMNATDEDIFLFMFGGYD
jgi:hypothetical protein